MNDQIRTAAELDALMPSLPIVGTPKVAPKSSTEPTEEQVACIDEPSRSGGAVVIRRLHAYLTRWLWEAAARIGGGW